MENEFELNPVPEEEGVVPTPAAEEIPCAGAEICEESAACQEQAGEEIGSAPFTQSVQESPKKKKGKGKRIVALALCCTLLGAVIGTCSTWMLLQYLGAKTGTPVEKIAGILLGQRENAVIDIEKIDTSKLMSAAEVYAANVKSTVSVRASGVVKNEWGAHQTAEAAGSGFILSHDGYILTNYHVVEGLDTIKIFFYDKRVLPATLIGYDESNDIAVLKVEGENLSPVVLGDSDNLNVGDGVVAIGNPLGELSFTLTAGYISAKDRIIVMSSGLTMTLLQTDCPINSGNSGGALFNMYGEVIGVTNAKYSSSGIGEASIDNIGFAIPMNRAKEIAFSIIEKGVVTKPYVGITVTTVTEQMQSWGLPIGALIAEVVSGSPAAEGGLQVDDIITHFNGEVVDNNSTIVAMVGNCKPGQSVVFTVYRGGKTVEVTVVIGEKVVPAN